MFLWVWVLKVGIGIWAAYLLVGFLAPAQPPVYFALATLWGLVALWYARPMLRETLPFEWTPLAVAKGVFAFLLSLAAAYSLSFAADMLFGHLFGIFPATVRVPIVVWTVIAYISMFVSTVLSKRRITVVLPWLVLGVYVLIGTNASPYPHGYLVALCLFGFAWLSLYMLKGRDQMSANVVSETGKGEKAPTPEVSEAAAPSREPEQHKPQKSADFWHGTSVRERSPSQDREVLNSLPRTVLVPCPAKPSSGTQQYTYAAGDVHAEANCSTSQGREPAEQAPRSAPAASYASRLKATQVARIRAIAAILKEIEPKSDSDWIEGFAMDGMPEREIACWEVMALAYGSFTSQRDLSLEAKQEVLQLALSRSFGRTNEQVLSRPANVLSEPERRDVLDHFSAAARALGTLDAFA